MVDAAVEALGLDHADTQVRVGEPATELALLAAEVEASVVVVGSRGLGAIKRVAPRLGLGPPGPQRPLPRPRRPRRRRGLTDIRA